MSNGTSKRPDTSRVSGFTLVELLVVIGIIAVLIGILLPVLGRAKQGANQVKCMANLRQLGVGLQLYASANKGSYPVGFARAGLKPAGSDFTWKDGTDWTVMLMSVFKKTQGNMYDTADKIGSGATGLRQIFQCPEVATVATTDTVVTHYTVHPRLIPDLETQDYIALISGITRGLQPYKVAKVKRATEVIVIFDSSITNTTYMAYSVGYAIDKNRLYKKPFLTDLYSMVPGLDGAQPVDLLPAVSGSTANDINKDNNNYSGNFRFRHIQDSKMNALMVDGHVQSFTYNKLNQSCDILRRNIFVNTQ